MPVYEYQCQACHKEFEYQQRMSDPDKTVCEACGGALERLISRTAFTLKGGGWYKDLYSSAKPEAKSSESSGTKSDAPAASSDSSSSSTKTDSSSGSSGSSGSGTSSGSSGSSGSSSGSGSSGGSTAAASAK